MKYLYTILLFLSTIVGIKAQTLSISLDDSKTIGIDYNINDILNFELTSNFESYDIYGYFSSNNIYNSDNIEQIIKYGFGYNNDNIFYGKFSTEITYSLINRIYTYIEPTLILDNEYNPYYEIVIGIKYRFGYEVIITKNNVNFGISIDI